MGADRRIYFFIVQTLVAGLWLLFLARRFQVSPGSPNTPASGRLPGGQFYSCWRCGCAVRPLLIIGWEPHTVLADLIWAIPPIFSKSYTGQNFMAAQAAHFYCAAVHDCISCGG
jgi:hypothetical protein